MEQAEAHGLIRLGVVARRAHGGEGAIGLAPCDGADGVNDRAGGETGGADAAGRQDGVGVKLVQARLGRCVQQAGDVVGGVEAFEINDGRLGCRAAVEGEAGFVERVEHGLEPLGPLRMADAGPVFDHVGVGEQGDAHQAEDRRAGL